MLLFYAKFFRAPGFYVQSAPAIIWPHPPRWLDFTACHPDAPFIRPFNQKLCGCPCTHGHCWKLYGWIAPLRLGM